MYNWVAKNDDINFLEFSTQEIQRRHENDIKY
jgi:hypothetical protein